MARKKDPRIKLVATELIALQCLECNGGNWEEVFTCTAKEGKNKCPLYDLRPRRRHDKLKTAFFDKDGSRKEGAEPVLKERKKREYTEEEKKNAALRLVESRKKLKEKRNKQ
jgi:hypothetical protein